MLTEGTMCEIDSTNARLSVTRRAIAAVAIGLLLAACGDSKQASEGTPAIESTTNPAEVSTTASAPTSPQNAALEAALLSPADLGADWDSLAETHRFPNGADLAATVEACAPFVDLVFDGGAQHGTGASAALGNGQDIVFTYVVAFDTEEQAAAMLGAVQSPGFAECWARFNEVAVLELPMGISSATYESGEPPALDIAADAVAVLHLTGEVKFGDTAFADTCTCVFVQAGRGVVEVHSTDFVFTPEERSALIQVAVERLRAALD